MNGDEAELSEAVRLVVNRAALGRVTGPAGPVAAIRTRDLDDSLALAHVARASAQVTGSGRVGDAAHTSAGGAGDDVHDFSLR